MKAQALSLTESTLLPEISLVIFVLVFGISFYRAYRPSAKAHYQRVAAIVLDDPPTVVATAQPSTSSLSSSQQEYSHGTTH